MREAIKKAIMGGYKGCTTALWNESVLLDPNFWQSLGKEEGWNKQDGGNSIAGIWFGETWKYYWHSFIEHLISGKDVDSFFKELIKS